MRPEIEQLEKLAAHFNFLLNEGVIITRAEEEKAKFLLNECSRLIEQMTKQLTLF